MSRSARSARSGRQRSKPSSPVFEDLEDRILLFKPYTHIATGAAVLADVLNPSHPGRISIGGQLYSIPTQVAEALENPANIPYYNAGVIGPDGFPDLIMGQSVIHPTETGQWIGHVLDSAWKAQADSSYSAEEKQQILAFSYGYLTHAAGDMWGHTLVNEFATGVFPSVKEVLTDADKAAIALRHIVAEGYIGDATPGFDGNPDRSVPLPNGDYSDLYFPGFSYNLLPTIKALRRLGS